MITLILLSMPSIALVCRRQRQCARIPCSRFLSALANLTNGAMPLSIARRYHCSPVVSAESRARRI